MSTGYFGGPQSTACDLDLETLNLAVEMFVVQNGDAPVTEQALVDGGLMRELSIMHDIGENNAVVPSPTGNCLS